MIKTMIEHYPDPLSLEQNLLIDRLAELALRNYASYLIDPTATGKQIAAAKQDADWWRVVADSGYRSYREQGLYPRQG